MAAFTALGSEHTNLIRETVRSGRYSLLLGAGFSASSHSSDGTALPIGGQLVREIEQLFNLPQDKYTLSMLAGAARHIDAAKLNAYFYRRFSDCAASVDAKLLSTFVWRSVFTLNIDDVLVDAYKNPAALQQPQFLTFRRAFTRPEDSGDVQIVHLHGSVRVPDDGYVFSAAEYGAASAQDSVWFTIAASELALQPFIVLGCNLEEPDLEHYLASRTGLPVGARQLAPSLFVTRKLDPVLQARCDHFGMLAIESDSDPFLRDLAALTLPRPSPIELLRPKTTSGLFMAAPQERDQRIFFRQWLYVHPEELPRTPDEPHLLTGIEPSWTHILRGESILREDARQVISQVTNWAKDDPRSSVVRLLVSDAGDGKSAVLLRASFELSKLGFDVYYFTGRERLIEDSTIDVLKCARGPFVLMMDSLAEQAFQMADVLDRLRTAHVPFFMVGAERTRRMPHVIDAFAAVNFSESEMMPLTYDEGLAIVSGLREIGHLGREASRPDSDIARQIERSHLLVGLMSIGSTISLRDRIEAEFREMKPSSQNIYAIAAVAHRCGFPIKLSVVQRAAKIPMLNVLSALERDLRGCVMRISDDLVETRHRVIAEVLTDKMSRELCFRTAANLARALSSYVSRQAIMRGTQEAKLAGRLLDYDVIEPLIGDDQVRRFYTEIKPEWGWNSRYWEQCALFELAEHPELAIKYAEHAVGIDTQLLPLTTLAKVKVTIAKQRGYDEEGVRLLDEGIYNAGEAVQLSKQRRRFEIHPYDVAIRAACDFVAASGAKGRSLKRWDGWNKISEMANEVSERFHTRTARELTTRWHETNARFVVR